MSWVDVLWATVASACLTLAALHALVWWGDRKARAHLLFAIAALGTASFAPFELWMLRAASLDDYGQAVRWSHVSSWVAIVGLAAFLRLYLDAGRWWLLWLVVGMRTLTLTLNFLMEPNVNYSVITSLQQVPFLGEPVTIATGVRNPWGIVGPGSLFFLAVFAIDATRTAWRRDRRRSALLIGGAVVSFALLALIQSVLVVQGLHRLPLMASLVFSPVVIAMGYELSRDALLSGQLARQLSQSEARMALAAEAAGFGVWTWGGTTGSVWGSTQWLTLFGLADDAPLNFQRVMERIHPDDRARVESALLKARDDGAPYAAEFRLSMADGSERWISSRGRLFKDSTGDARMIGASTDITARLNTEHEISNQRAKLAHLARLGMLGELSGSVAHELNQPLTAILSNAQAAQRFLARPDPDLEEVRVILEDIVAEDRRAGEVIRRLRLMFRKGEVERQPLIMGELFGTALHLLRNDLINRGVTATMDVAAGLPVVHADPVGLQQVLINLVMNACDAMVDTPRWARRVSLKATTSAEGDVVVSVTDNGTGIDPSKLALIFDSFYTDKPNGMGLGLSVCRTIITAHGGLIWVENKAPQGAVFHFKLPVMH